MSAMKRRLRSKRRGNKGNAREGYRTTEQKNRAVKEDLHGSPIRAEVYRSLGSIAEFLGVGTVDIYLLRREKDISATFEFYKQRPNRFSSSTIRNEVFKYIDNSDRSLPKDTQEWTDLHWEVYAFKSLEKCLEKHRPGLNRNQIWAFLRHGALNLDRKQKDTSGKNRLIGQQIDNAHSSATEPPSTKSLERKACDNLEARPPNRQPTSLFTKHAHCSLGGSGDGFSEEKIMEDFLDFTDKDPTTLAVPDPTPILQQLKPGESLRHDALSLILGLVPLSNSIILGYGDLEDFREIGTWKPGPHICGDLPERFIMPFNVPVPGFKHWVVYCFDVSSKTIELYDPLQCHHRKHLQSLEKIGRKVGSVMGDWSAELWEFQAVSNIPQHTASNDSGIFAFLYMLKIAMNEPVDADIYYPYLWRLLLALWADSSTLSYQHVRSWLDAEYSEMAKREDLGIPSLVRNHLDPSNLQQICTSLAARVQNQMFDRSLSRISCFAQKLYDTASEVNGNARDRKTRTETIRDYFPLIESLAGTSSDDERKDSIRKLISTVQSEWECIRTGFDNAERVTQAVARFLAVPEKLKIILRDIEKEGREHVYSLQSDLQRVQAWLNEFYLIRQEGNDFMEQDAPALGSSLVDLCFHSYNRNARITPDIRNFEAISTVAMNEFAQLDRSYIPSEEPSQSECDQFGGYSSQNEHTSDLVASNQSDHRPPKMERFRCAASARLHAIMLSFDANIILPSKKIATIYESRYKTPIKDDMLLKRLKVMPCSVMVGKMGPWHLYKHKKECTPALFESIHYVLLNTEAGAEDILGWLSEHYPKLTKGQIQEYLSSVACLKRINNSTQYMHASEKCKKDLWLHHPWFDRLQIPKSGVN